VAPLGATVRGWVAAGGLALAAPAAPAGTVPASPPAVLDRWPGVAAAYAVERDGRLLWGAALDTPRAPASLAKLLTALVLVGDGWHADETVVVGPEAARAPGTRVGLRTGERLRAGDLLTAMLVHSANDACRALVAHAGGADGGFRARLAGEAARLGLRATTIVEPCGLDAPGQQTTARDLLRLAAAASAEPQIALRARAQSAHITTAAGRELAFATTNALIGRVPEAVGLKSGYTLAAGRCLVAIGERAGHRATVVLLGATEDRWWTAAGLLTYALADAPP
jgi:D-alanyl-D-alanine carboxypeptidase (penicillin-binding protein 5/6)